MLATVRGRCCTSVLYSGCRTLPAGAPAGTYLALAALNRLVAPCSKLGFADWWKTTAAYRFTKVPATVLDQRRFWDAMHAVGLGELGEISRRIAVRMTAAYELDISSVALGMTSFATFIDSANKKAPVAQRGQRQAEAIGPADRRTGPGGHSRRRDPADLARLPRGRARRHPVRHDDRPAPRPVRGDR
jgi:hypothetical protein